MAEDSDDSERTEEPSSKKLEKARGEGQIVQSQEVRSWAMLFGTTLGAMMLMPGLLRDVNRAVLKYVESPHALSVEPSSLRNLFAGLSLDLALALAPILGLLMLVAVAGNITQFGLVSSPKKMAPKWSNLSPMLGLKRMFGVRAWMEFFKGLMKLAVVGVVVWWVAYPLLTDFDLMPARDVLAMLDRLWTIAIRLAMATVGVMTFIAALDFGYQFFAHMKKMRMTKQEVKDEHKQTEGDPLIKSRIRRIRMERARKRMMAAVPSATVVVTNPTHYAVALSYKIEEMQAPTLVAKGVDFLAKRIRELAEEHDVPVVENPPLARALYAAVDIDQEIPHEHYKAVAEVVGYVMRLKGKLNS